MAIQGFFAIRFENTNNKENERKTKMLLNGTDEKIYWRLTSYIKIHLPQAYYSKKIVKNMQKYGHLGKVRFGQALIWGTEPEIVVKSLDNGYCGVDKAFGCFESSAPNKIILDSNMVEKFQNRPEDTVGNCFFTASGLLVPIIGGTILHELCHWGNFKAGYSEPREMGEAFELATYGVVIGKPGFSLFSDEEEESIKPG